VIDQLPRSLSVSDPPQVEISVVLPCLNEYETVGTCVSKAISCLESRHIRGEVIVADNSSTDRSVAISKKLGAKIVHVPKKGYGAALKAGIKAAQGEFVVMGDSDGSYDFSEVSRFIKKFDEGYDIVMGNRFQGGIEHGAMPFLNRYVGNPLLTAFTRMLYGGNFGDTQCGLRGGKRSALLSLDLHSDQFEFASEMIVKTLKSSLRYAEVPVKLRKDDPDRHPHLRPFRDGLRHMILIIKERF